MNGFAAMAELEFKYHELSVEDRSELIDKLAKLLDDVSEITFAYVHGGFMERDSFRDLDVAIWIEDRDRAFFYTVDFSAKIEVGMGVPVDIQVLNEAPLPFKYHVFTQGKLLFSKDEVLRIRMADEVIRQYMDVKKLTDVLPENR